MTLLGVSLCEGSDDDLNNFIDFLNLAVKKFIEDPEEGKITSEEFNNEYSVSNLELKRVSELVYQDHEIWSGATHNEDGTYSFNLTHRILKYEDIKNFDDYINIIKDGLSKRFGGKLKQKKQRESEWYEDYEDEDEIEPYSPPNIGFISDSSIRTLIEKDLEELYYVLEVEAWKSATILAASIAESILLDLFKRNEEIARRTLKGKWPNRVGLYDMVKAASSSGLISEPEHAFFDMIRIYRNQIHPDRACHESRPDEFVANALTDLVYKLLSDMKKKYKSKKNKD